MPDLLTLPSILRDDADPTAIEFLQEYFGVAPFSNPYNGAYFERIAGGGGRTETRDVMTADDLLSVTMLSVQVKSQTVIRILGRDAGPIAELLVQIPSDLEMADADLAIFAPNSPVRQLWALLHGMPGIGWVIAGKLLARKRPRLLPVYDRVVQRVLSSSSTFWVPLAEALRADNHALQHRLLDLRLRSEIGTDISALRVFDVVVWMYGQRFKTEPLSVSTGTDPTEAQ